jgi:glycerol-3-phosphate acyltransferase PlsY
MVGLCGYLLGAIPFGYLVVKLFRGQDIRRFGSGRTGGSNVIRAAGWVAGLLTGAGDIAKGAVAVWGAAWLASRLELSSTAAAQVLAGVMTVVGHNYSAFLSWRGGAGTGPNIGVATGFWFPALFILLPLMLILLVATGYASLTSLTIAGLVPLLFAVRALLEDAPWAYVAYGVVAAALVVWALRPNIARLKAGTERLVGPRAKAAARKQPHLQQDKTKA